MYNGTHMSDETFITLRDLKTGKTYNHAGKPCAPPADGMRTREIAICIGTDEGENLDKMQRLAKIDKVHNEPASVTGTVIIFFGNGFHTRTTAARWSTGA